MKKYHLVNNILGWLIGFVACAVYIMTAEATASWWDCGEYIATAFKLQVGHPPGAPTFQIIGRIFSLFTDPLHAANAVNNMSAVASGLCIMFLYWTITLLGKKILLAGTHPETYIPSPWTPIYSWNPASYNVNKPKERYLRA